MKADHKDQLKLIPQKCGVPVLEETNGKEIVAMSIDSMPFTLVEVCIIAIGQPTVHSFIYIVELLVSRIPITSKTKP